MSVHKCKMCGGNVIVDKGKSTGKCDSCGIMQTVSLFSDEKRKQQDEPENHFRNSDSVSSSNEVGSSTKTADRMNKIIETYIFLEEYKKAKKSATEMNEEYPDDYRGWWGYILAITGNFTLDLSMDRVMQHEIEQCMRHIRKLAPGPKYEGCNERIIEYVKAVSRRVGAIERTEIEEKNTDAQKALKDAREKCALVETGLRRKMGEYEDTILGNGERIDEYDDEIFAIDEKLDYKSNIWFAGKFLLICFTIFAIFAQSGELFQAGIFIAFIAYVVSKIGEKKLRENREAIERMANELSKSNASYKSETKKEIHELGVNRAVLVEEISKREIETSEYTRYLEIDESVMAEVITSGICASIGIDYICNMDAKIAREQLYTAAEAA